VRSAFRHLASAVVASFILAAPAAAQGYVYRDIAWGSDPRTTTDKLAAEGFELEENFAPDEGEVMYNSAENPDVIALASFAGDRLVGVRVVFGGENVDELFEQSVREWTGEFGAPDEEEERMVTWRRDDTAFSLLLGETDGGHRFLAAQYTGPGYDEEIQRRIDAMSAPIEYPALDPRWVVVPIERPVRSAFDRATVQAMGNRVFRVWLREDYGELQASPVEHDMALFQVDYDCAGRRFRVGAETYQRQGRLVHTETPAEPSDWIAVPPESVGEMIITAVCRAAERR
jgi:hypothetical protein